MKSTDKLGFIKIIFIYFLLKSYICIYASNDAAHKVKIHTEWKKISGNHFQWSSIQNIKELLQFNSKKKRTKNPIKKWAKNFYRYCFEENIQMTHKHLKRCSISLVIREKQI